MLKKILLVIGILLMCLGAQASDTDWLWRFNGTYFGTAADSTDGIDANDKLFTLIPNGCAVAIYNTHNVGGWDGATDFYSKDVRSPLPSVMGQAKTWRFYLWADLAWTQNVTFITWGYNIPAPAFDKIRYTLTYVRAAQGITGGDVAVGTSINLRDYGQWGWSFPRYTTTDGRTGYVFELTATVIPEPSSLLALFSGLVGVGFAVRRKKPGSCARA